MSFPPELLPEGLCSVCNNFPFNELASEEEDALPHHKTLEALEESAESCSLCSLIWYAAGCSLCNLGGMGSWRSGVKLPSGHEVMVKGTESNYNSMGMRALENGAITTDFSDPEPDYRPPQSRDPKSQFPEKTDVRPWLFESFYEFPMGKRLPQSVGLGVRLGTSPRIEDAVGNSEKEISFRGTYLRYRIDHDACTADSIPGRLVCVDSGSPIAFQKLKDWLAICDKHHDCVSKYLPTPLPTRILDVATSPDTVFLRETKCKMGRYIALSHCWGLSHRITTTKNNIEIHKQAGIALSELPATFRDAVQIARELNVAYLWVDSLCIMQDDARDWGAEASRMGDVYSKSYLTISALSSLDDSTGCFPNPNTRFDKPWVSSDVRSTGRRCFAHAVPATDREDENDPTTSSYYTRTTFAKVPSCRDVEEHKTSYYITPEWMPSSTKTDPKTYLIGEFGASFDPISWEPLNERAWTLQERLLAPRTIHYGLSQMYWECQLCVFAEDGAFFRRRFKTMKDLLGPRPPQSVKSKTPVMSATEGDAGREDEISDGMLEDENWQDPWFGLVEQYTSRKLTMDQDKLPAISGLATIIAARTGDTYYAGLWKSSFIAGLNWSVDFYEPSHYCDDPAHDAALPPPSKSHVKFPTKYRAPSWSWASLDATIRFGGIGRNGKALATCLEVQITPEGNDVSGRVKTGWVKLKGPTYTLLFDTKSEDRRHNRPFSIPVQARGKDKFRTGTAHFDLEPTFPSMALLLDSSNGLILKEKSPSDSGVFVRIGTVSLYRLQGCADAESQTVDEFQNINLSKESTDLGIANGEVRVVVIE